MCERVAFSVQSANPRVEAFNARPLLSACGAPSARDRLRRATLAPPTTAMPLARDPCVTFRVAFGVRLVLVRLRRAAGSVWLVRLVQLLQLVRLVSRLVWLSSAPHL